MIKYVIRRKTDGALYCRSCKNYGYFSTDTNKPIKFYTKIGYAKLGLSHLYGNDRINCEIIPYKLFNNNEIYKPNKNDEYFMNICKDFYYALKIKCNITNPSNVFIEDLTNDFGEDINGINPEFQRLMEEFYNKFEK